MEKRKEFAGAKPECDGQYPQVPVIPILPGPMARNRFRSTSAIPVENAAFPWRRAVDGFLYRPRYAVCQRISRSGCREYKLEVSEKNQLLNLLDEQTDAFRTGFSEKLSMELHRDGTASEDAVTGLDALVSLTPETGVVGGIDRETATYWRNNAATAIAATTAGALATAMEGQWRRCIRNGGSPGFHSGRFRFYRCLSPVWGDGDQ